MKLYLFPAGRAVSVLSLKNYLGIDCEIERLNFRREDQRSAEYKKLNPNMKMPTLEDDGFVLWESNAILFYLTAKAPDNKGLWPADIKGQADVLRWFAWENQHWDAESVGLVSFEKGSKVVMGLGPADPAFIARGEQNFARFAAVLDGYLAGKTWLVSDRLSLADFSVGGVIPSAQAMELSIAKYPEISRWYAKLSALPGWHTALST
jgi:glutathione S-transferase